MKKKPYNYSSKNRLTNNSNSFPFNVQHKKKDPIKSLENTLTKFKVIDDNPKENIESLDNGFLEGRVLEKEDLKRKEKLKKIEEKKEEKRIKELEKKKRKEEKEERKQEKKKFKEERDDFLSDEPSIVEVISSVDSDELKKEKNTTSIKDKVILSVPFFKHLFLSISSFCALLLVVLLVYNVVSNKILGVQSTSIKDSSIISSDSSEMDDNYLFVGGFYTSGFSFDEFGLDYHYVKVGDSSYTTSDLLSNMKGMVYDFNPSIIFLEFGVSDFNDDIEVEEYLSNYQRIIENIKSYRPNATIYVESLYPINKEISNYDEDVLEYNIRNDTIVTINKKIKNLAKEEKVNYLDLYTCLLKDNQLNSDYTNDGVHLNHEGYYEILNKIKKVIG